MDVRSPVMTDGCRIVDKITLFALEDFREPNPVKKVQFFYLWLKEECFMLSINRNAIVSFLTFSPRQRPKSTLHTSLVIASRGKCLKLWQTKNSRRWGTQWFKVQSLSQPRFQGLSSSGKKRNPGNEVASLLWKSMYRMHEVLQRTTILAWNGSDYGFISVKTGSSHQRILICLSTVLLEWPFISLALFLFHNQT